MVKDPIKLGGMISNLIGFDISDINALVGKLGGLLGVSFPMIDAAKVICASTVNNRVLKADKAQILKLVIDYVVVKCLGDRELVGALIDALTQSTPS